MIQGYLKLVDGLNKVIRVLVVAIFMVMFVATFLQVLARNLGLFSIPWSDELCRFLIVWMVYLGAGLAARTGRLIRMEVLPMLTKMGDRGLHRLYWIAALLSLVFCLLTTYCAGLAISVNYKSLSAALKIPMAVPYLALPVGCIFMLLNLFANVLELTAREGAEGGAKS